MLPVAHYTFGRKGMLVVWFRVPFCVLIALSCLPASSSSYCSGTAGQCTDLSDEAASRLRGGDTGWCNPLPDCEGMRDTPSCNHAEPPELVYSECGDAVNPGEPCFSFTVSGYPEECNTSYGNQYCQPSMTTLAVCYRAYVCECEDVGGVKYCSRLVYDFVVCKPVTADSFNCSFDSCEL